DLDIGSSNLFEPAALHKTHGGVDDRFCREPVGGARFKPEYIAWQMKGADLTSPVGEELVGADRSGNHLVDIFGRFALAVDLLIPAIGEFIGDETSMSGERSELVGSGEGNRTDRIARDRNVQRLGKHGPSPSRSAKCYDVRPVSDNSLDI